MFRRLSVLVLLTTSLTIGCKNAENERYVEKIAPQITLMAPDWHALVEASSDGPDVKKAQHKLMTEMEEMGVLMGFPSKVTDPRWAPRSADQQAGAANGSPR